MKVKLLNKQEILPALKLVSDVFQQDIAYTYTSEGVDEFYKFIAPDFMLPAYERQEIIFFGAYRNKKLIGTMAVRCDGHICLFFVKKEHQGKGVGKMLFQTMYNYCVQRLHVEKITVNAAPGALAQYQHLGMQETGPEEVRHGIRAIPMEMPANTSYIKPPKNPDTKWMIGMILAIAVLIAGAGIFMGSRIIKVTFHEPSIGNESYGSPETTGIDAIEAYTDKNLPYEITDETYQFEGEKQTSIYIDCYVQYPQINGIDDELQGKINTLIKETALSTWDKMYQNPTEEIKEAVITSDAPVLVNYVQYKVTYAGKDFISIVMENQSMQGKEENYVYDFQTLNISLKDGTVYEVKDIVDVDKEFVSEWLDVMREEAGNKKLLSELNKKEMIEVLNGKNKDGTYVPVFFVYRDGIEIGLSFHYDEKEKEHQQYAWVTAPFSLEVLKKHQSGSSFWKEL